MEEVVAPIESEDDEEDIVGIEDIGVVVIEVGDVVEDKPLLPVCDGVVVPERVTVRDTDAVRLAVAVDVGDVLRDDVQVEVAVIVLEGDGDHGPMPAIVMMLPVLAIHLRSALNERSSMMRSFAGSNAMYREFDRLTLVPGPSGPASFINWPQIPTTVVT